MIVDKKTAIIICTDYANSKKHDFRLFKDSKVHINPTIQVLTDTGYLGLDKIHSNTFMPKKKSKKKSSNNVR